MQNLLKKRINIVSYNIHHGADIQDVYNIEKIISTINNLKPNVVCLQEVDNNYSERSLNQNQPQVFLEQISAMVESKFSPTIEDKYGIQALTQDKIIDYHTQLLKTGQKEDRAFQFIRLENGLQIIHFHLSHLVEDQQRRQQELQLTLDYLDSNKIDYSKNTIVCGDFNEDNEDNKEVVNETIFGLLNKKKFKNARDIFQQKQGSLKQTKELYTFTRKHYNKNIDHFYVTSDIQVELFEIIESDASDHNPILLSVLI